MSLTAALHQPAPHRLAGLRLEHSAIGDWWDLPEPRREAIMAWMDRNIAPGPVRSVRLTGEGTVQVERAHLDDDGQLSLIPGTDEIATYRVTETVAEPPPPEWWDAHGQEVRP